MRVHLTKSITRLVLIMGGLLLSSGVWAQQRYYDTDTVCAGDTATYGVANASLNSTYNWTLSSGGTIYDGVSTNDSLIEVGWGMAPGTYTLNMYEQTAEGCLGDTVTLDVVINDLPTVAVIGDSVCSGDISHLNLEFTGEAPWIFVYEADGVSYTDTATSTPHVVDLPVYTNNTASIEMKNINILSVMDGNSCYEVTADLPSTQVGIFPTPQAGPIFHY